METLRGLDTDVFIDHFRELAAAMAYIQALPVAERATTPAQDVPLEFHWSSLAKGV